MDNQVTVPAPYAKLRANLSTVYFRQMFEVIGLSQSELGMRLGVSARRIRYLMAGSRLADEYLSRVPVVMSYCEQYAMEALAVEALSNKSLNAGE